MSSFFPGEEQAIRMVIAAGECYGYGNMIAHLSTAWAKHLMKEYGLPREVAIDAATGRSVYESEIPCR
jgi:hypothetical protein